MFLVAARFKISDSDIGAEVPIRKEQTWKWDWNEHASNGCGKFHQIFWIQSYNQYTKYIEEVRCNEYFAKPRFQEMLRALRIHLHCNSVYSAIKQILWPHNGTRNDDNKWRQSSCVTSSAFRQLVDTFRIYSTFSDEFKDHLTFLTGVAFCCFLTWCLHVALSAFEHIPYLLNTSPLTLQ